MKTIGKALIIPATIIVLALIFQKPISNLIGGIDSGEAEFKDFKFKFTSSGTDSFDGDLSPTALYYLLGLTIKSPNVVQSRIRYEEPVITAVQELKDEDLVEIVDVIKVDDGSPEMRGDWLDYELTDKGSALLERMGLSN